MSIIEMPKASPRRLSFKRVRAEERAAVQERLAYIAEHHPMTAEQRHMLVMALGVLAILESDEA